MDFLEACKLINQACVLTDSEKTRMIANARKENKTLMPVLEKFKDNGDQILFYDNAHNFFKENVDLYMLNQKRLKSQELNRLELLTKLLTKCRGDLDLLLILEMGNC